MRHSASLMRIGVHAVDWLAFAGAGALSFVWRFDLADTTLNAMYAQLIFGGASMMLLVSTLVYRSWRGGQLLAMLGRVGLSWLITWGLIMTWLVLTQTAIDYSRLLLAWWAGSSLVLSWLARVVVYLMMSGLRSMGVNHMKVLMVGTGLGIRHPAAGQGISLDGIQGRWSGHCPKRKGPRLRHSKPSAR